MRRLIIPALVGVTLALAGCSSSDEPAAPATSTATTSKAPMFDRDAAQRESWESARDMYSADLKLSICDAAKKGGKAGVKALLTDSERMPFVVERPDYDAGQWVTYCASK